MCDIETDGFTWKESVDAYDRRIWKLLLKGLAFPAAIVFDYSPGVPPYKLNMLVADVPVSWHTVLQDAKQTALGHVAAWQLHIGITD